IGVQFVNHLAACLLGLRYSHFSTPLRFRYPVTVMLDTLALTKKPLTGLGDFTATPRLLTLSGLALGIGALSAFVALGLLKLIGLFTNIFFYQRFQTDMASPIGHQLGWWAILVPVVGGLVIGVMARYGSERIRGHGIPEAIEAILLNGSRVQPKLAVL